MVGDRKRELADRNLGDENLRLFFCMVKKLNGEIKKDSTLKHMMNLSGLQEREVKTLLLRYKDFHTVRNTLEFVGDELKLCRERVRQIIAKALRKLRQPRTEETLRDFTGERDYK